MTLHDALQSMNLCPMLDQYYPLDDAELRRIENRKIDSIPEPLRTFLSKYGMARFRDFTKVRVNDVRWLEFAPSGEGDFDMFLGAATHDPAAGYDLWSILDDFEWRMPAAVLPFAHVWPDFYTMGLRGPDRGKVFYYLRDDLDLEEEEKGPLHERITDYENMFWVADSFEEFLDQIILTPWDELDRE